MVARWMSSPTLDAAPQPSATDRAQRSHVLPYGVTLAEHDAQILREQRAAERRVLVEARLIPNGQNVREVLGVIGAFEYARGNAFILRHPVATPAVDDRWTVFCGVKAWPSEERRLRDAVRGVISAQYRAPWSLDYQGAVNGLLLAAGVSRRGETGMLSAADLLEMEGAMQDGTSVEAFAQRIIDLAAAEESRRRGNEWLCDHQEGAQ